jgi:hypothetical protein
MKINPKCLYGDRDPAFTNKGYFLPCCWCDNPETTKELEIIGIFEEELHIDNLNSPEEIKKVFTSDEWKWFYKILLENPENAPWACKRHCSVIDGKEVTQTLKYHKGRKLGAKNIKLVEID